jgi:cell division septation protein DedD
MDVKEHEERSYSARYLILIFLVCVATCGVFFSLGYLVGNNEHGSRSTPVTEVVTAPSVVPPNINPPAENVESTLQSQGPAQKPVNPPPDTLADSPADPRPRATSATAQPSNVATQSIRPSAVSQSVSNPPSNPQPTAGEVGEGVTLQVVASRSQQDAEHIVDILKQKGYPVFLATPEFARADDKFFRVLVGPFRTRAEAERVRDQLVREGFKDPFIRH